VLDPENRMSAVKALGHSWLTTTDSSQVDVLRTLETGWMKQLLARRRWHRWFNAVKALQRMRRLSSNARFRQQTKQQQQI